MSIYRDFSTKLYEKGLNVIPVKGKRPIISNWSKFSNEIMNELDFDEYCQISYEENIGIGLVLGEATNVIAVDVDVYNFGEDKSLYDFIIKELNPSPVEKKGAKGFTRFYKYNGEVKKSYKNQNGQTIVDLLSNGSQTVLPPSIHPETGQPYVWTTRHDLESIDIDDLPTLDSDFIPKLLNYLDRKFAKKSNIGRHNYLVGKFGFAVWETTSTDEELAERLLQEDKRKYSTNSYFNDSSEPHGGSGLQAALFFAKSITKTILNKNKEAKRGILQSKFSANTNSTNGGDGDEYELYKQFFDDSLVKKQGAKKDFVDDILKFQSSKNIWKPVGNSLKALKSYAISSGIKISNLENHFNRYQDEKESEFLFSPCVWDGKDHIAYMCSFIKCSNLEQNEIVDLFKHWLARVFAKTLNKDQNTMIVFHGGQGKGKDTFFEHLLKGFEPYFSNFTDCSQEKDMFTQASRSMILNVSELDRLMKKSTGLIKDLITRQSANFRPSHQQYHESYNLIASFIGSTNRIDFLTDSTGNRRFWIFENVEIDWSYSRNFSDQIRAQAFALYEENYCALQESLAKVESFSTNLTPDAIDQFVISLWNKSLGNLSITQEKFTYPEVADIFFDISKHFGFRGVRKIQTIIKQHGGSYKNNDAILYRKIKTEDEK